MEEGMKAEISIPRNIVFEGDINPKVMTIGPSNSKQQTDDVSTKDDELTPEEKELLELAKEESLKLSGANNNNTPSSFRNTEERIYNKDFESEYFGLSKRVPAIEYFTPSFDDQEAFNLIDVVYNIVIDLTRQKQLKSAFISKVYGKILFPKTLETLVCDEIAQCGTIDISACSNLFYMKFGTIQGNLVGQFNGESIEYGFIGQYATINVDLKKGITTLVAGGNSVGVSFMDNKFLTMRH